MNIYSCHCHGFCQGIWLSKPQPPSPQAQPVRHLRKHELLDCRLPSRSETNSSGRWGKVRLRWNEVTCSWVLGPCLFLLYINDLPHQVSSPSQLFADDTILYHFNFHPLRPRSGGTTRGPWSNTWKCGSLSRTCPFTWTNAIIYRWVSATKYLGLTIQSNIGWDKHIGNIYAKGNKMLRFMRRNLKIESREIKEREHINQSSGQSLSTLLAYRDPGKDISRGEKIQLRAAPFILNWHHNTSGVEEMLAGRPHCLPDHAVQGQQQFSMCGVRWSDPPARHRDSERWGYSMGYNRILFFSLFFFNTLLSQWEFLPWEIWVTFPKESQLQQSHDTQL